ncbi:MAG: GLPGLI family protein [Polaribacter sp.]|uniref:GLPGLI family protein n=1 Tax=Polaribacter sp. TaxID=1920175 RepID=UPI002F3586F4
MKKKLTLLFIIFINTVVYAQSISGKVTYVVSMESFSDKKIDSISKKLKEKKIKMNKWVRDIFKNTPNVNAFLVFSNGESLYIVEDKMQNDGKKTFNINRTFAGGDNRYYKNTKTKEYFFENNTAELLLTDLKPKKWKITQESKIIGGYLCYKAIDIASTNKKMKPIAWFTPQIPVSFGPKEFNGLLGLVILVEKKRVTISASKIVLNHKKNLKINKPTKGKKETIEEYEKRVDSFMKFLRKKDD